MSCAAPPGDGAELPTPGEPTPAAQPAPVAPDLTEVLIAAQLGAAWALRVLYDQLAPKVHGYLRARGAAEADELTSDVFLTVFQRLPTLTGGAAGLRTFTFSVAHARLVDSLRKQATRPAGMPYDPQRDTRQSRSAEEDAEHRESAARATAMLRRLPPDQASVLSLRIIADLSLEETALAVGRSVGAVKQLQRRALIALKSDIAGDA
ncbi:MAG: RNA polymerase sigma factor ShbA [Mycobacteriales bacterium]